MEKIIYANVIFYFNSLLPFLLFNFHTQHTQISKSKTAVSRIIFLSYTILLILIIYFREFELVITVTMSKFFSQIEVIKA